MSVGIGTGVGLVVGLGVAAAEGLTEGALVGAIDGADIANACDRLCSAVAAVGNPARSGNEQGHKPQVFSVRQKETSDFPIL